MTRRVGLATTAALAGLLAGLPVPEAPGRPPAGPSYSPHGGAVLAVAFAPDGRALASGGADRSVRLCNVADGKELWRADDHDGRVSALAFAPDGRLLASAGGDGVIRLRDPATGRTLRECQGHGGWVLGVAFAPDGRTLASAGYDGVARLWDAATGRELRRFEGHDEAMSGVALTPDGGTLVTAGYDGCLRFWDVRTGKLRRQVQRVRRGEVTGVIICGRKPWVLSGAANGSLGRAGLDDDEAVFGGPARPSAVLSLGCSADGKVAAVGRKDGEVELIEVTTGRLITTAGGKPNEARDIPARFSRRDGGLGAVRALALAPAAANLAVGVGDGRLCVWSLRELLTPEPGLDRPDALWQALAEADPGTAYAAVTALAADPARAVPLLAQRLQVARPADADRVRALIAALGDDDFARRERASAELGRLVLEAEGLLRQAQQADPDLEVRVRLQRLLDSLEQPPCLNERLRWLRAVTALEQMDAPEAGALLRRLAQGRAGALLTEDAAAALARVEFRARKPGP
jgi:hypothetical protein